MPQVSVCAVQNALHVGAELLALGEHFVELVLAEHGAQSRLGQHVRGRQIVLDLDNRALRIDYVEIEHRVDFHRNIVVGDDVLAGDFNDLNAQVHPHHLLDEGNQHYESRALDLLKTAKGEDDGALVFAQDAHRGAQTDETGQKHEDCERGFDGEHDCRSFVRLFLPRGPTAQSTMGVVRSRRHKASARRLELATTFGAEAASDSTHEVIEL